MKVSLEWITENAERRISDIARVSNPKGVGRDPDALIAYLIKHKHWSPFEMVSLCLEVETVRDVSRQLLRHSLRPQEFSQRYADVAALGDPVFRPARLSHPTNRQASIESDDKDLNQWWETAQARVWDEAASAYENALKNGIAKEVARAVLPEGMTPTRLFLSGSVRDHLFCWHTRKGHGTQPETVGVADAAWAILEQNLPVTCAAFIRHSPQKSAQVEMQA